VLPQRAALPGHRNWSLGLHCGGSTSTTRLKSRKAFTLIELVVVIVIIGILVALAGFAYQSVVTTARSTAAVNLAVQFNKSYQAAMASGHDEDAALDAAYSDLPPNSGAFLYHVGQATVITPTGQATVTDPDGIQSEDLACAILPTDGSDPGSVMAGECP